MRSRPPSCSDVLHHRGVANNANNGNSSTSGGMNCGEEDNNGVDMSDDDVILHRRSLSGGSRHSGVGGDNNCNLQHHRGMVVNSAPPEHHHHHHHQQRYPYQPERPPPPPPTCRHRATGVIGAVEETTVDLQCATATHEPPLQQGLRRQREGEEEDGEGECEEAGELLEDGLCGEQELLEEELVSAESKGHHHRHDSLQHHQRRDQHKPLHQQLSSSSSVSASAGLGHLHMHGHQYSLHPYQQQGNCRQGRGSLSSVTMETSNDSPTVERLISSRPCRPRMSSSEVDAILESTSGISGSARAGSAATVEDAQSESSDMERGCGCLIFTLRVIGILRFPPLPGHSFNWRNIYPFGLLLFVWFGFFRLFSLHLDPKPFGVLLFVDIMWHSVCTQTSLGMLVFLFPFSRQFHQFLAKWTEYKKEAGGLPVSWISSFVRKVVIFSVVFTLLLFVSIIAVKETFGQHDMVMALSKASIAPWCQTGCPRWVLSISDLTAFFYSFPWLMMQTTLSILCYLLQKEFALITQQLRADHAAHGGTVPQLERHRRHHQHVCHLVSRLDEMLSLYVLAVVGLCIPMLVFLIYCLIFIQEFSAPDTLLRVSLVAITAVFSFILFTFIMSASCLHTAASEPQMVLYNLRIGADEQPAACLQVQLFLSKLTSNHIGLTAWRLFPINRPTLTKIVTLIATYIVILLKFRPRISHETAGVEATTMDLLNSTTTAAYG